MRVRVVLLTVLALAMIGGALPASAASLEQGDRSNLVSHLQIGLTEIGFYRGPIDGSYGPQTAQAVMAFHKHLGLERTFSWQAQDWSYLETFEPLVHGGTARVDVDLDRQVLYLHDSAGEVAVIPVSSANGDQYAGRGGRLTTARTPTGEFSFQRHIPALRVSYLGGLWKPWYFYGGYAIHGSSSVPAYPASHGCIRVPNWEADWLSTELTVGTPLSVARSGGAEPPPPPPPPPPVDRVRLGRLAI